MTCKIFVTVTENRYTIYIQSIEMLTVGERLIDACSSDDNALIYKLLHDITLNVLPSIRHLSEQEQKRILSSNDISKALCLCVQRKDTLSTVAILDDLSVYISDDCAGWCLQQTIDKEDDKTLRILLRYLAHKISVYSASIALEIACQSNQDKLVLILLNNLSHLFDTFHSCASLRTACENGNATIVECIINFLHYKIDERSAGWSLKACIDSKSLEALQVICKQLGDKIKSNHAGYALKYACKYCGYEFVQCIMQYLIHKISNESVIWAYRFAYDNSDSQTLELIKEQAKYKLDNKDLDDLLQYNKNVVDQDVFSKNLPATPITNNIPQTQQMEPTQTTPQKPQHTPQKQMKVFHATNTTTINNKSIMSPRTKDSYNKYIEKRNQILLNKKPK
jgi:hypothetical protein